MGNRTSEWITALEQSAITVPPMPPTPTGTDVFQSLQEPQLVDVPEEPRRSRRSGRGSNKRSEPTAVAGVNVAQTAKWSNGSALGSRAVGVGVVIAVICGPVALGLGGLGFFGGTSSVAPLAAKAKTASTLEQSAGSFASGFVGAWLSATSDNSAALGAYTGVNVQTFTKTGFEYRDVQVASSTINGDVVQVVVAANVKDTAVDAEDGDQWPRRYFQVNVSDRGGKLTAIGLPAPVAGPKYDTDDIDVDYSTSVAATSAVGKTVSAFLAAYLTGQGDTEPYTSPKKSIPGIDPAPYAESTVSGIDADKEPAEHPKDGDSVDAYVTATATDAAGQKVTATYAMTLHARAGRWEIYALGTVPALADTTTASDGVTSAPSATPASTERN